MNRAQLLTTFPTRAAFAAMSRTQQNREVADAAVRVLDAIAEDQRQPDAWESDRLLSALDGLRNHRFVLAMNEVQHALVAVG